MREELKHMDIEWNVAQQDRIHGFPSRVRVGRGCISGHYSIWVEAVRPKTANKTQKKVKRGPSTDQPTAGQTKRSVELWST